MLGQHDYGILDRLYNLRCIGGKHTSRENVLKGFYSHERGIAEKKLDELIKRNYIIPKPTSYGEQISLNPSMIVDIKNFLNPSENKIEDKPPLEDSINPKYEKRPFKVTEGDKMVKGVRAKYSYHRNLYDNSRIVAYIVVNGEKTGVVELGSFNNPESLLSKAVRGIDKKFKGMPFTKPDLYSLGKDIEGNRQPPKAIIDMLIHFGYSIPKGKRHYQRTPKQLPTPPLDIFRKKKDDKKDEKEKDET